MVGIEARARFVADLAPIGTADWKKFFAKRYGQASYEEVVGFVDKDRAERMAEIDEALRHAIRSAAECYPDDRIYPGDDSWSYSGPDY